MSQPGLDEHKVCTSGSIISGQATSNAACKDADFTLKQRSQATAVNLEEEVEENDLLNRLDSDDFKTLMSDSLNARVQHLLSVAENQLNTWEQSSLNALDETFVSAINTIKRLQCEVVESGKNAGEAIANMIDHYADFEASVTASEKLNLGVEHFETLLRGIEDSHFAHSVQYALQQAKSRLLTFEEMPKPWRSNPYIIRGYRFYGSPRECVHALWSIHNETCNIWTHLAGAFLLLGIGVFHLPNTEAWQNASILDKIPILLFLTAALKCLLCSATWHTFCNIAHLHVKQRMACVDYMGITVLITASIMTTEYAILYDHPVSRVVYMLITLISGILGVNFNWSARFDKADGRLERIGFFVGLAGAGMLSGIHACFIKDPLTVLRTYIPVLKSLLSYGIGIIFYALHIPERFAPGTIFDYLGMSHNFWHICVMVGIYFHYKATVELFAIHATPLRLT